jgi:hypothetical protein
LGDKAEEVFQVLETLVKNSEMSKSEVRELAKQKADLSEQLKKHQHQHQRSQQAVLDAVLKLGEWFARTQPAKFAKALPRMTATARSFQPGKPNFWDEMTANGGLGEMLVEASAAIENNEMVWRSSVSAPQQPPQQQQQQMMSQPSVIVTPSMERFLKTLQNQNARVEPMISQQHVPQTMMVNASSLEQQPQQQMAPPVQQPFMAGVAVGNGMASAEVIPAAIARPGEKFQAFMKTIPFGMSPSRTGF